MIDGVRADRDAIGGRELKELCWCHCPGIRRRCQADRPTFRYGVQSRFDLRHREGQQMTTHGTQLSAEVSSVERDADSPTACCKAEFAHSRRAGPQKTGETIPPESRVA